MMLALMAILTAAFIVLAMSKSDHKPWRWRWGDRD
jgi:hypothetical protein